MSKDRSKFIRLGLFVIIALALFIVGIYSIGSKKSLFGSHISISAEFRNIKGALPGNNVRYSGLIVGSVESIDIVSDTVIRMNMNIDKSFIPYIKKDAIASIGTKGLVGENVIDIYPTSSLSEIIEEGDIINTQIASAPQTMLNTLDKTNENVLKISEDLLAFTENLHHIEITTELTKSAENMERLTDNLLKTSNEITLILQNVKEGKGAVGYLLNDEDFSRKTEEILEGVDDLYIDKTRPIIQNLEKSASAITQLTSRLDSISSQIDINEGFIGFLLKDSTSVNRVESLLDSVDTSIHLFNENMNALQHNFLFKRYFKKKRKAERNALKNE
jgi:phospholipid/cholesterol/gamma-HCH transport system substrate-binding protein